MQCVCKFLALAGFGPFLSTRMKWDIRLLTLHPPLGVRIHGPVPAFVPLPPSPHPAQQKSSLCLPRTPTRFVRMPA